MWAAKNCLLNKINLSFNKSRKQKEKTLTNFREKHFNSRKIENKVLIN